MQKLNTFNKPEGALNVTLYKNNLSASGGFYGKVSRRTVDLEQLIALAAEKNEGVSKLMMHHVAAILQSGILELLAMGYSVNILDLGTLYLSAQGSVSNGEVPNLRARFTPSALVNEQAAKVNVEAVLTASEEPVISGVIDTAHPENNGKLSTGIVARVEGEKIKLGGETKGIFFVPLDESGNKISDETKWVQVKESRIKTNFPQSLEFYVPKSLETGKQYVLAVRTQFSSGSNLRKTPVTGFSDSFEIVEDTDD